MREMARARSEEVRQKADVVVGVSGKKNSPYNVIGMVMRPSIMNSHLQPARPLAPFKEEWIAV